MSKQKEKVNKNIPPVHPNVANRKGIKRRIQDYIRK